MKKVNRIHLSDEVVLGDVEMRYVMGGSGTSTVTCKLNSDKSACENDGAECEPTGWFSGSYGKCTFKSKGHEDSYKAKCECKD